MRKKLEFYFSSEIKTHLSLRNGKFYNGTIHEVTPHKEIIIFIDDKLGNLPIFFEEIEDVEPFREVGV